jgi:hypothetical protein
VVLLEDVLVGGRVVLDDVDECDVVLDELVADDEVELEVGLLVVLLLDVLVRVSVTGEVVLEPDGLVEVVPEGLVEVVADGGAEASASAAAANPSSRARSTSREVRRSRASSAARISRCPETLAPSDSARAEFGLRRRLGGASLLGRGRLRSPGRLGSLAEGGGRAGGEGWMPGGARHTPPRRSRARSSGR